MKMRWQGWIIVFTSFISQMIMADIGLTLYTYLNVQFNESHESLKYYKNSL